jgi:hypothetical protein
LASIEENPKANMIEEEENLRLVGVVLFGGRSSLVGSKLHFPDLNTFSRG